MKFLISAIVKIVLFPIVVVMLIPAYALFIINPNLHSFNFKMER